MKTISDSVCNGTMAMGSLLVTASDSRPEGLALYMDSENLVKRRTLKFSSSGEDPDFLLLGCIWRIRRSSHVRYG
ncbi:hypothetical protein TNCV_1084441 [Trichonephila clavipes]|nr:hypothetical protein TNCV_1084441 [Trichonephila clavipes]